jgi:hypothetical protein
MERKHDYKEDAEGYLDVTFILVAFFFSSLSGL